MIMVLCFSTGAGRVVSSYEVFSFVALANFML